MLPAEVLGDSVMLVHGRPALHSPSLPPPLPIQRMSMTQDSQRLSLRLSPSILSFLTVLFPRPLPTTTHEQVCVLLPS